MTGYCDSWGVGKDLDIFSDWVCIAFLALLNGQPLYVM